MRSERLSPGPAYRPAATRSRKSPGAGISFPQRHVASPPLPLCSSAQSLALLIIRSGAALTRLQIEGVAGGADGAHEIDAAIAVECLAQAADVDVDRARLDIDIMAPNRVQ